MSVHLYTSCWNEELILPFFLRHYEPLVDRIVVYDDNSTDRTRDLLAACPKVETRPLQRGAQSFLDAHLALFETRWHESRGEADWVCLVDLDEFIFHPDWDAFLATQKDNGVTIMASVGYDMVSETFPPAGAHLATTLTRGQRDLHLDKPSLFVPDAIDRINHTVGRHCCSPTGQVVFAKKRFSPQLRHYKSLGLDYLLARSHALVSRLTEEDRARGWSGHWNDDASIRAHFIKKLAQAEEIPSPPRLAKAPRTSGKRNWWRRR